MRVFRILAARWEKLKAETALRRPFDAADSLRIDMVVQLLDRLREVKP